MKKPKKSPSPFHIWAEFDEHQNSHQIDISINVCITYNCPMDKFWDDDLKKNLNRQDILKALQANEPSTPRYSLIDEPKEYYQECYEKSFGKITKEAMDLSSWKLVRNFGKPDFYWLREFTVDAI